MSTILESTQAHPTPTTITESVEGSSMEFVGSLIRSPSIPPFIPADQAYFWSAQWQDDEREALAEIAAGNTQSFADPSAAIRYLLSDEP
jgi:hypothetical protein